MTQAIGSSSEISVAPSSPGRGVATLALTEVWERFSYAGMRSILVLYLTQWLLIDGRAEGVLGLPVLHEALESVFGTLNAEAFALQIYGLYVGVFYLTAIAGGLIADFVLGHRYTVMLGGTLMMIGQFCLAVESLFVVGLVLMVCGGGLFKPTISAQLGALFDRADSRRERAFAIFYVAINVGTFMAPLVCGTLGEKLGWHLGFLAGGVGMALSLLIYWIGRNTIVSASPTALLGAPASPDRGGNLIALLAVAITVPLFWAAYEQKSGAVLLWAKQHVNLHIAPLDLDIPASWILMLNPLSIFILTPLLNTVWRRLGPMDFAPLTKMALGCTMLSISYLALAGMALLGGDSKLPFSSLAVFMSVLTLGELLLSPIGLSLFSRLAPPRYTSATLSVWFLATFAGNYGSGLIASMTLDMHRPLFFAMIAILPAAGAVLLFGIGLRFTRNDKSTKKGKTDPVMPS